MSGDDNEVEGAPAQPHEERVSPPVVISETLSESPNRRRSGQSDDASDVVRTLFVTGFPKDARYREIYNFFRFWEGFIRCDVNIPATTHIPVAFVLFEQRVDAEHCMTALSGLQFDPEQKFVLRLEFAKANTLSKKRPHTAFDGYQAGKRPRLEYDPYGQYKMPPPLPAPVPSAALYYPPHPVPRAHTPPLPVSAGNTTLFVANLSAQPIEQDIANLFQLQDGFRRIRFGKGNRATAFVEFMDTDSAGRAMLALQGREVPGSTLQCGLRIEVARSRMGMPSHRSNASPYYQQQAPPPQPAYGGGYPQGYAQYEYPQAAYGGVAGGALW